MDHKQLKSPPIVEAVCEFLFSSDSDWDWTVPGKLSVGLAGDYPKLHQVMPRITVVGDAPPEFVAPSPERIQLLANDELTLVQSGPRMLSVNRLSPYLGWGQFSEAIRRVVSVYDERCGWPAVRRIGLLYVNRISTAEPHENILNIGPNEAILPELLRLDSFAHRLLCAFDDSRLDIQVTTVGDPAGFLLQFDASTTNRQHLDGFESLFEWLELAHETTYRAFRATVTDNAWHAFD